MHARVALALLMSAFGCRGQVVGSECAPETGACQEASDDASDADEGPGGDDDVGGDDDEDLPTDTDEGSFCDFQTLTSSHRTARLESQETPGRCLQVGASGAPSFGSCDGGAKLQLVVDPSDCGVSIHSRELHTFIADPGVSIYTPGAECVAVGAAGLEIKTCAPGNAAQTFTLHRSGEAIRLEAAGAGGCLSLSGTAPELASCDAAATLLTWVDLEEATSELTLASAPTVFGTGNFWDTMYTEVDKASLAGAVGFRAGPELKYLQQSARHAYIEFDVESTVNASALVHIVNATPFSGVGLDVYQDGALLTGFETIHTDSWKSHHAGPSFLIELVAGATTRLRLESRTGASPLRIVRIFINPPLPGPVNFGVVHAVSTSGVTHVGADTVQDVYRIRASIEGGKWWWHANWTHSKTMFLIDVASAGDYAFTLDYKASPSKPGATLPRWGKRIVLDEDYPNQQVIEVAGDSAGTMGATLSLSEGIHRLSIEAPDGEYLGIMSTSDFELSPL